ncbi:MAG: MBOAT family protein [Phycisphaerales bacterium]|nr:MBOAT family protein [Phycisphaerales bacterium]
MPIFADMVFTSFTFVFFLAVVLPLYYALSHRWQNRFLLVASYVFYGAWDWRFLSLLAISTVVDYLVADRLHRTASMAGKRILLGISLCGNLGLLAFFKYFNFFLDSFNQLSASLGLGQCSWAIHIILPVGISFYTFQTMGYVIDVYRGRQEPARNFLDFALYVSYFPQLVAGPIERAGNLLPAIYRPRKVTPSQIGTGLQLILMGYLKKIAIADAVAPYVNDIFADPAHQSSVRLLLGLYLFAIQIYGDFSGYSDIARGVSRLLGIELMINFKQPYLSANITEFWRRWHISLSTWLRDYLYIPLGGNRKGTSNTYRNLMLTMLLGGLWHGADGPSYFGVDCMGSISQFTR